MATVINTTFKLKRGSAVQWAEVNPILGLGEPGFVYDLNLLKIGNGVTAWNDLPYLAEDQASIVTASTRSDFPESGNVGIIYRASQEKQLYQWNEDTHEYELLLANNLITQEQLEAAIDAIEIPEIDLDGYATEAYTQELFNRMVALTHEEVLEICK